MPGKIQCPTCASTQVYHSRSSELIDVLMGFFGKQPFRCKICNRRFHAHEWKGDAEADAAAGPASGTPSNEEKKP